MKLIGNVKTSVVLLSVMLLFLSACSSGGKSYVNASEEVKTEVDFILSKASIWDPGRDVGISFGSLNGKSTMKVTVYQYSKFRRDEWDDLKTVYEYDVEKGTFSKKSEDKEHVLNAGYTTISYSNLWNGNMGVDKKKEYLFQRIMKSRENK